MNLSLVQQVSDIVNQKKPANKGGRPKTTGTGHLIALRLLPDLLRAVDEHMKSTNAESRPEAIRQILTDYLKRRGYIA